MRKIFTIVLVILCSCNKQSSLLNNVEFNNFNKSSGYFKDMRDNKVYKWVKINGKIWMAENLAFKVDSGCVAYKNRKASIEKYGYLYSYSAALQAVPEGWRLPTKIEYEVLCNNFGKTYREAFETIKAGSDYGLDFKFGGYYLIENNAFSFGFPPRLKTANFWAEKDPNSNKYSKFIIDNFFKGASVSSVSECCYYSVRCIKIEE